MPVEEENVRRFRTLAVDPEFESLIPLPTDDHQVALERNVIESGGPHAPIIIWKESGLVLDGHRRYRICEKHKLPFAVKHVSLPDRNQAKLWILDHYSGIRNLSTDVDRLIRAAHVKLFQEVAGVSRTKAIEHVGAKAQVSVRTLNRDLTRSALAELPQSVQELVTEHKLHYRAWDVAQLKLLPEAEQIRACNLVITGEYRDLKEVLNGKEDVTEEDGKPESLPPRSQSSTAGESASTGTLVSDDESSDEDKSADGDESWPDTDTLSDVAPEAPPTGGAARSPKRAANLSVEDTFTEAFKVVGKTVQRMVDLNEVCPDARRYKAIAAGLRAISDMLTEWREQAGVKSTVPSKG